MKEWVTSTKFTNTFTGIAWDSQKNLSRMHRLRNTWKTLLWIIYGRDHILNVKCRYRYTRIIEMDL
jgi:hypothetical protein